MYVYVYVQVIFGQMCVLVLYDSGYHLDHRSEYLCTTGLCLSPSTQSTHCIDTMLSELILYHYISNLIE